jgi:site-specific recombinase XerD
LAPFAAGLEEALVAQSYSKNWALQLMALAAEVSHWLQRRGLGVSDLSEEVIGQFFAEREPGRSRCRTVRSMRSITAQLRSLGVVVADRTVGVGRTDVEEELLNSYRCWCVSQRGLTSGTADSYIDYMATFLVLWRPVSDVVIAELDGRAVLDTIRAAAESMASPSLRCLVTALRSFLRFLHATGHTRTSLVTAVPALRCWPRTALASTVSAGDARRLVASCDTTTARGRREAAIVLVLVRLGLRAGEVAHLTLDDVDWRAGELTIRGNGGRIDQLPLPVEVGEAMTAYLRGVRPPSSSRSVFLTVAVPIRPMSSDAVASLVSRTSERAGIGRIGPHVLRRTLATETLRVGAPMSEVAQLLRHSDQATTSIYAAVDAVAVAALAQPWPVPR